MRAISLGHASSCSPSIPGAVEHHHCCDEEEDLHYAEVCCLPRKWGHPGLHRCFDFRVALIFRWWLIDFSEVCVCVCVWHQRFRELSNPRSFEAPLLLCIRRYDTYCALYDIHSIQSPSSVFFGTQATPYYPMQRMPNQNCNQYRKTSLSLIWRPGSRLQGFLGLENRYPQILWNISLHLGTCTTWDPDIILHLTSRIFPSWSSSCPTCWQKWHAAQKSMISSWRCWSNLTWMLESFWANKSDVPISAAVIALLLKFSIWHHVMSCCVVILSLLVNKKPRQQWCLGTFMKHLKISRHPLLLELLVDSADQQMDS